MIELDFGYWSTVTVTEPLTFEQQDRLSKIGAHFWWEYHDKSYPPKPHPADYPAGHWCIRVRTRDLPELHARLGKPPTT